MDAKIISTITRRLDHDYNEGVNDNGLYYHYGYTQSNSNYGKGYPGFASDHHYHRHELNHDYANHRHSCFIAINGATTIHIATCFGIRYTILTFMVNQQTIPDSVRNTKSQLD